MQPKAAVDNLLNEIAAHVAQSLKLAGIEQSKAMDAAADAAEAVRLNFRGQLLYIPANVANSIHQRNEQLVSEFTGSNHSELSERYGISVVHVYRIIKQMLLLRQRSNKNSLITKRI